MVPPPATIDLRQAPTVLCTDRLRLETPGAQHAPLFAAGLLASQASLGFVAWHWGADVLAWAQRFCEREARSVAQGEDLCFHLLRRDSGAWVGRIDVHSIDFDAARGEIGYVGDLRHAGQGLMREAVRAVIGLCFGLGFERIEAMSDARNSRALHFADATGLLQREGLLRRHERDPQGRHCDMVLWAALNPHADSTDPRPGSPWAPA